MEGKNGKNKDIFSYLALSRRSSSCSKQNIPRVYVKAYSIDIMIFCSVVVQRRNEEKEVKQKLMVGK